MLAATPELRVAGENGDDGLDGAGRMEVAGVVRESLDGGGVANVDVLSGDGRCAAKWKRMNRHLSANVMLASLYASKPG
jgi:hypothetical protein